MPASDLIQDLCSPVWTLAFCIQVSLETMIKPLQMCNSSSVVMEEIYADVPLLLAKSYCIRCYSETFLYPEVYEAFNSR